MAKLRAVLIGATGLAGQQFIAALEHHPDIELTGLAASPRSAGKSYVDALRAQNGMLAWFVPTPLPERIARMIVLSGDANLNASSPCEQAIWTMRAAAAASGRRSFFMVARAPKTEGEKVNMQKAKKRRIGPRCGGGAFDCFLHRYTIPGGPSVGCRGRLRTERGKGMDRFRNFTAPVCFTA